MAFLKNWLDAGRAKQVVQDAHRVKYPDRPKALITPYKHDNKDREHIYFVTYFDGPKLLLSWWSVSRSDFKAAETAAPKDFPS